MFVTRPARARLIALLVAGALFMNLLDGTAITTALPTMGHAFGTSAVNMNLGITAYLLALAVFMPLSGWIADRLGARLVFGSAIAVFIVASVLCAWSRSLPVFVLARVAQAIGAAMMQPVGRLVVLRVTPKHELMGAMAMMVWPALVAPIIGPPIGGYITTYLGWTWIFYLNVPLGIAAIAATAMLFPADSPGQQHPFDVRGFLFVGFGCFSVLYGLDIIGQRTASAALVTGLIGFGITCLIAAVLHLRGTPHPLFDLSSFKIRTFAVSLFGGSISRLAIGSVPFLLPLMFQLAFGMSAAASGLLLFWLFAGNLAMKTVTTPAVRRFGFRNVLLWNGVITVISVVACAALAPQTPFTIIAIVLFLGGASRSMQFTAFSSISFADVPQERMSGANTLSSTLMQLSSGLGVALGALTLRASAAIHKDFAASPSLNDFHLAFIFVAAVAALGIIDVLRLPADAGREVSRPTVMAAAREQ
jgi:EmrB/QacA subfamily drug resistance transporter